MKSIFIAGKNNFVIFGYFKVDYVDKRNILNGEIERKTLNGPFTG